MKPNRPNQPQTNITLITCYFGTAPTWIRIYLQTALCNPDIEFLIFTDCIPDVAPGSNVRIIPTTLEAVCEQASKKLNQPIAFDRAFKLNDLRPAFGVIFDDYLMEAGFWGYVEVDMIYGHIRSFITPALLEQFDVITSRPEFITGHFTLFRNDAVTNTLFTTCVDYPQVFTNPKHYSWSECNFIWTHLLDGYPLETAKTEVESITHVVHRAAKEGRTRAYFPHLVRERIDLKKMKWLLHWDNGRLYDVDGDEEIMYFHFHVHKYREHFIFPDWLDIPPSFYVHEHGFFV